MAGDIVIVVPGPPAAKGRGRATTVNGHARVFTPAKTRTREGIVAALAMDAMRGRPPLPGPVAMTVEATMPIPRSWSKRRQAEALSGRLLPTGKPDATNLGKLIEDGLNGIAYRDDAQIVDLRVTKAYGDEPGTVVTIREVAR